MEVYKILNNVSFTNLRDLQNILNILIFMILAFDFLFFIRLLLALSILKLYIS